MIYQLIDKICKILENKNIDYMISGSLALNHYVMPRMTMDLDLVIELNQKNIDGFLVEFDETKYYLNKNVILDEVERRGMFNIIDFETGFKIDFIVRKDNEFRQLEFSRKKRINLGETIVWMVTVEDLVISKLIWIQKLESQKQIADIKNLLESPNIDMEYIKKWIKKLDLNTYSIL